MKLHYLLLFLIVQISYSQLPDVDRADQLASQGNYTEEIILRRTIIKNISDKNSEDFKIQNYKMKLAEFYDSYSTDKRLEKILEVERVFNTLESQDPSLKIQLGIYHTNELVVLQNLEDSYSKLHSLFEFAEQHPNTSELEEQKTSILKYLGDVALDLGEYDNSIGYYNQAIAKSIELFGENSLETASIYKALGIAYSFTDDFQASLSYLERALEIYERIQPEDKFILFDQYTGLYERYKYYGDSEKVNYLYNKITTYYESNKNDSSFINSERVDYPNLNAVETIYLYVKLQHAAIENERTEVEQAFESFVKTMPFGKVNYNGLELNKIVSYHFETGYFFHKLEEYQNFDNYHKAKKYYLKALKFTQEVGFEFGELQAYWILSTLGADYKQWDDVIEISNTAFENPSTEKFNQLKTLKHNLALAYGGLGQYDEAMSILEEEYLEYFNGNATDYYAIDNLMESGNLYWEMYETNPQPDFLEKAYNNFHLCSVIFSRLYRGGEFSPRLSWYQQRINDGMLRTASSMNKNLKAVAERVEINNSDYLWSSFLNNRKEPFNESSVRLQDQLDSLDYRHLELIFGLKSDSLQSKQRDSLRYELKSVEKQFAELSRQLSEEDNSFYQFSRTDFDLEKLQKSLRKSDLLIRYVISQSSVYAYTIQRREINLKKLSLSPAELKEKVIEYLTSLKEVRSDFALLSKELYAELLEPLDLEKDKNLIIVPLGVLSHIPFETFITAEGSFLVEEYSVSYVYSLRLLEIQKSIKDRSKNMLAAFSPDYSAEYISSTDNEALNRLVRSGNYELRGARQEAQNVNSIFGGDLYMGSAATKSNFLENISKYDIIHLAMHALVDEHDANASNFIFDGDERLYLSEFYNMKIPSNLAVLSACDTGSGALKDGEGVQSLSRAFTYAGVKSTVMSLWPVPDRETSAIMIDFYINLKAGKSKDEALKLAKINYLKNVSEVELRHPYYWAGFIVSGDVAPLETGLGFWWYIGIALLVLLLLFWYLKRKRYL